MEMQRMSVVNIRGGLVWNYVTQSNFCGPSASGCTVMSGLGSGGGGLFLFFVTSSSIETTSRNKNAVNAAIEKIDISVMFRNMTLYALTD